MLYTAHVDELSTLSFLVNHVLMKKERLPHADTLEGLLMLRAAWDMVDIGNYQIYFFKWTAKICYVLTLLLGVAIVTVTTLGTEIDASVGKVMISTSGVEQKGSQLITFLLSLAATFTASIQAFYVSHFAVAVWCDILLFYRTVN